MEEIKEGDVVVCINPGKLKDIGSAEHNLKKGQGYKVLCVRGRWLDIDTSPRGGYARERFIKINI